MSTLKVKNADSADKYIKGTGAATSADPFVATHNVQFTDSPSIDAFGRLRVSNPRSLFDSKQLYDKSPLFWDEETSGGSETSTHSTSDASVTMTVTANTEFVIRQTFMRFDYQPGKSQQILTTFVLGSATTDVTKRVGYFNSNIVTPFDSNKDGIYLEQDGTTQNIVQSKNGTATSVAQASWNIDVFDGTGVSGVTLDWTKAQIMIIDFEWLGVGRVRVGFVVDGLIYYAHEFLNANSVSSVYMSVPNHSIRYEIRSTGGTDSLEHICASVISEGGVEDLGKLRYKSTEGTHVDADSANSIYAVVGLRLKSTNLSTTIKNVRSSTLATNNDDYEWMLIMNPTVAGTFTYSGETNSSIETATGATANTVTGGTIIDGGFVPGNQATTENLTNAINLGAAIDGTVDELVLCVRPLSANLDAEGSITWREYS